MRTRTTNFKNQIKEMGREIDSRITFDDNSFIDGEKLFSIKPILNAELLKSTMKGFNFECSEEIDIDTRFKYEFGLLVNDQYEYLDFGYYYVHEREYNEDTQNWTYKCYDKMRLSMVEYKGLQHSLHDEFPMTVRSYIDNLCSDLNISFANSSDTFVNYDKIIEADPYVDINGDSVGYIYRDILDELSAVVAGNLYINNDDELEIKYINDTNDQVDEEYLKDINVKFGEKFGPLNTIILTRSAEADTIYASYPENLPEEDRIAFKIVDNQIMNGNDRADYLPEILNELKGLEFYINDYTSTGIMYYELLDLYNVRVEQEDDEGNSNINTYKCLMLNDEPTIEEGLTEKIFTPLPEKSDTDYENASKDDRTLSQVYIIAKKNEGKIVAVVRDQNNLENRVSEAELTLDSQGARLNIVSTNIDEVTGDITALKTTSYELNENGFKIDNGQGYKSISNTEGTYYYDGDTMISKYTKDGSVQKDMAIFGRYYYGVENDVDVARFGKDKAMFVAELYEDNEHEIGFGHFYNGS